jgi:hypothetical protein
MLWLVEL